MPPNTSQKNYQALWFIIYFGILLQGFKVLLQFYMQEDRLSFGYFFLLGIPSALIAVVVGRFTSGRPFTIKIVAILILLTIVILTIIWVRSIDNG